MAKDYDLCDGELSLLEDLILAYRDGMHLHRAPCPQDPQYRLTRAKATLTLQRLSQARYPDTHRHIVLLALESHSRTALEVLDSQVHTALLAVDIPLRTALLALDIHHPTAQ